MSKSFPASIVFASGLLFASTSAKPASAQTVSGPPYASAPAPRTPPEPPLGPVGIAGVVVGGVGLAGMAVGGAMMLYTLAVEPCDNDAQCAGDRSVFFAGLTVGLVGLGGFLIPGAIMFGVDRATATPSKRSAEVPDVFVGPTSAAVRWQL